MLPFPPLPDVPEAQRATGSVGMRYEDVAQDGALKVCGMPHAIGMVCFRDLWQFTQVNRETRPLGIAPILSRLIMQAASGPISVRNAVEVEGRYQLAHTVDGTQTPNRLLLRMHAELFGPKARTRDPEGQPPGPRVHVGRVFAEHVFTRPWGPPEQRKVLSLPLSTGELIPPERVRFASAMSTLSLPEGATWIEPELAPDAAPIVFALTHTDSNQHVNSLVYPQLFEDAALRRLSDLGHDTAALLVEHIDIAFRKPCFSGQRVRLWTRAFALADRLGAVGYLGAENTPAERASCMCVLGFRNAELSG